MIREMPEDEFAREFFAEFADLECGDHFHAGNPQHVEWVRKRIAIYYFRGGRFYAHCLPDGTPTGFAAVLIDPGLEGRNCFGHKAELLDVIIRETYRGKGYGSALLGHAEAEARAAGAYCLYVATYAGNADSMTFYINRGFVPVALHPDVHGPGDEGEVHLRKILRLIFGSLGRLRASRVLCANDLAGRRPCFSSKCSANNRTDIA
ncbi:MAG: GNAT family N-acetyltransferase [Pseudomonadota bacterium]